MNEKVENLVLEQLRAIRTDMGRMSERIETLGVEMRAMRHQMAAVVTLQEHDHSDVAGIRSDSIALSVGLNWSTTRDNTSVNNLKVRRNQSTSRVPGNNSVEANKAKM